MLRKQKIPIYKLNESGIQPKELISSYQSVAILKKEYMFVQHRPYESAETTVGVEVSVLLVHYLLCDYLLKMYSRSSVRHPFVITEKQKHTRNMKSQTLVTPDR